MATVPSPLYQELSDLQSRIAKLTQERDAGNATLEQERTAAKEADAAKDALHDAIVKGQEVALKEEAVARQALEQSCDQLRRHVEELEHQLANAMKDMAESHKAADDAQALAMELAAERDAFKGQVATVEDPLKARIDELKERLSEAGETRVTLEGLKAKVADLERKLALLVPLAKLAADASELVLLDPAANIRDEHLENCLEQAVKAAKDGGAV